MTVTTAPTETPDVAATTRSPSAATPRTTTLVAGALWVFVVGLLAYGVVQTAVKAVALFG